MVQKNQYTYNVPPGSSTNPYGESRNAEFDGTGGMDGRTNEREVQGTLRGPWWPKKKLCKKYVNQNLQMARPKI